MALDARGNIAIFELLVYVIFLGITGYHVFRFGFKREGGWIYLLGFSLVRVVGASVFIGAEASRTKSNGPYIIAYVLEASGLSILLLTSLSYLAVVSQVTVHGELFVHRRILRAIRVFLIVAGIVAIIGGVDSPASNPDLQSQGASFRRISGILYLALFLLIAGIHAYYWTRSYEILWYRKTLLVVCSITLLPLTVRVIYALFSSLAPNVTPNSIPDSNAKSQSLYKFNIFTGEPVLYVIMDLLMEMIVMCIYCTGAIMLPLGSDDYAMAGKADRMELPVMSV